ncbi:MAG: hypothetical protein ABI806_12880 [Candidatus Solibacter sp.]
MSDTPGAKLLARVQRQLAAHERAWFRAHRELVRLAATADDAVDQAIETPINRRDPEVREMPERTQLPALEAAAPPDSGHLDLSTRPLPVR